MSSSQGKGRQAASLEGLSRNKELREIAELFRQISLDSHFFFLTSAITKNPDISVETACEIIYPRVNPPARLPWVNPAPIKRSYIETMHYKELCAAYNPSLGCLQLQVQRVFGMTFPFFLPARYHSMDCAALLEHSGGDECVYVSNAAQFLVFNQIYGPFFWCMLEEIYVTISKEKFSSVAMVLSLYFHSLPRQARLFTEERLQLCPTAAEFVLQPWLLIQLPWHPLTFVQWLVAVHGELLVVWKELVEFYRWPVPHKLHRPVKRLLTLVETLFWRVFKGYALVGWLIKEVPVVKPALVEGILDLIVLPSMATVEFVTSKKAIAIARALKQQAWPVKGQVTEGDDVSADTPIFVLLQKANLFCHSFWKQTEFNEFFFTFQCSLEEELEDIHKFDSCVEFKETMHLYVSRLQKIQGQEEKTLTHVWDKMRESVIHEVKLMVKQRLKGQVDFGLIHSKENKDHLLFAESFYFSTCLMDFRKGVAPKEMNILHSLGTLFTEARLADHRAATIGFLYALNKEKGNAVYLCAPEVDDPSMAMTLRNIEKALTEAEASVWTRETLEMKFPEETKAGVCPEETCPDIGLVGPTETMKTLENRIKKLVFTMYKVSSSTGLQDSFYYPDWPFIQYILPSFVTLIGSMTRHPGIKPIELATFTHFVHSLIQSFELHPLRAKYPQEERVEMPEWLTKPETESLGKQIATIEINLGLLVHGSFKKVNKPGSVDFTLGRLLFSQLNDPASTFLSTKKRGGLQTVYVAATQNWVSRMTQVLRDEMLHQANSQPLQDLMRLMFIAEELKLVAETYSEHPLDPMISPLLDHVDRKIKTMMMLQPGAAKGALRPDKKQAAELQQMSLLQVLGVVIFSLAERLNQLDSELTKLSLKQKPFQSAQIKSAVEFSVSKDWRGLKTLLGPLLTCPEGINHALVTMDFASKKAPSCYRSALGVLKLLHVRPSSRALLPLMPIKICRCCATSEAKLTMCTVCLDNIDFEDIHWFCSKKCEEKCLADGHYNDHDYHMMVKVGLG